MPRVVSAGLIFHRRGARPQFKNVNALIDTGAAVSIVRTGLLAEKLFRRPKFAIVLLELGASESPAVTV